MHITANYLLSFLKPIDCETLLQIEKNTQSVHLDSLTIGTIRKIGSKWDVVPALNIFRPVSFVSKVKECQ